MNDKQLATLFMGTVLPAVQADARLATVQMARNFQRPTTGASTVPYLYFFKIGPDRRYGHPKRRDVWNTVDGRFDHTELQVYESPFQFMAWAPVNAADVNALTESDILNIVCGIMQSDAIISAFRAAGVGILRVSEVRNPFVVDDRDQFAASPSFDIVLTHARTTVSTLPAVVTYDANLSRV